MQEGIQLEKGANFEGGTGTYSDFHEYISKLDVLDWLMNLQRLTPKILMQTSFNIEFKLYTTDSVNYYVTASKDFLAFLTKELFLLTESGKQKYDPFLLGFLAHKYLNLECELNEPGFDPKADNSWLWLLRTANLQWHYLRHSRDVVGRWIYLFKDLDESIQEAIKKVLGVSAMDIIKIGVCIFSVYLPQNRDGCIDYFSKDAYVNSEFVLKSKLKQLLSSQNFDAFVRIYKANREVFLSSLAKFITTDPKFKKYEFNPIKRFPILETASTAEKERLIITNLSDFVFGFSEGLYFVLLDCLSTDQKKAFLQAIGNRFENFVGEMLERIPKEPFKHTIVKEREYDVGKDRWKNVDWTTIGQDTIIQIECKKRKPNIFQKSGLVSDENREGIDDLLRDIPEQLKKMDVKANHLKAGLVPGIKYTGQNVKNILVYLDEMFTLEKYAGKTIRSHFPNSKYEYHVLGIHEFEWICQYCVTFNKSFHEAIASFFSSSPDPGFEKLETIDFNQQSYEKLVSEIKQMSDVKE